MTPPPSDGVGFAVAVVDSNQQFRTRVAIHLAERVRVASFASLEALEDRLPPGTSVVVVVGPSMAGPAGLQAVERLDRSRPEIGTVLVVEELTTDLLQRALRAGVKDVLPSPLDPNELANTVQRVLEGLPVGAAVRRETPSGPEEGKGRVITVFSTKGGAGKSVVATNLAVALARKSTTPVVLVDADLQFGDVGVMLKMAPDHTIVEAVSAGGGLDAQLLWSLLVRHEQSGLWVLAAPVEPAFADQISSQQMLQIVNLLREQAGYVVIDTPASLNDVVLALIENSDDILYVAGMDIPSIKNSKIGLQILRLLNVPMSKLSTVLNRANSKVKLEVSEVERTLGISINCMVPSEVTVPQSVNKGIPVVLDAPRSGAARALEELADRFLLGAESKSRR